MYNELLQLNDNRNYKELFYRRKDILEQKNNMKKYFEDYLKVSDAALLGTIKQSLFTRVRTVMEDLSIALSFALDKDNHKQFDDVLSSTRIEELNLMVKEKQYLIEQELLKDKILKLKDKINLVFKEIDGIGLSVDYNSQLDDSQNPELKKKCTIYNVNE